MKFNVLSFNEEKILEMAGSEKKSGLSIMSINIEENIKVHGKISRGVNIEFDVACSIVGVNENEIIVNLDKIKLLGLPLPKNMVMSFLESNIKSKSAKLSNGKIYVVKSAAARVLPELKGVNIEDVYVADKSINIKVAEAEQYSIV